MKKIIVLIAVCLFSRSSAISQPISLTEQEKIDLEYLYEEERLANDVYQQLADKWKVKVFVNIAQSEKRHYSHLLSLLGKYQIAIPKNEVGFYNSAALNQLYDRFIKAGTSSFKEALLVAAQFEEYDIVDLEEAISRTEKEDIKIVYHGLRSGSMNHLRALYKTIKRHGYDYEPVLLNKVQFQEIISKKQKKRKGRVITF